MRDGFGREIDYVRVSVTDRCNLRCIYCMPEEGVTLAKHQDILSLEELLLLCENMAAIGISKFKITGGEPLVRKGIIEFIEKLNNCPGVETITLTTNGLLLRQYGKALKEAGVSAINISLDTLDPERFARLTRLGDLTDVLDGLDAVADLGFDQLKINCVPMEEMNGDHLLEIALLAKDRPTHVRFIELMPIGLGKQFTPIPEQELVARLEKDLGPMTLFSEKLGNGPARYYSVTGFAGKIGFISAVTHSFCADCNRIRLTAGGFLKTCLQYNHGTALKPLLEGSPEDLQAAIKNAILAKPAEHSFGQTNTSGLLLEQDEMSQIGG